MWLRFFVRPFSFPIRVSSFSFSVSFSPKNETFSFHISGQIFPSPTKLSYTMMFSSHIVPFLTHCHFDFPLRRGSTTMWAGKMELWPWPWTMEEGETMFVSGRIYINLGTCEIWGHLFALLKNSKHQQHKSPAGCWQCFTKQLLTWSLESDLMKLLFCNFVYMRCQWSFAESFLY